MYKALLIHNDNTPLKIIVENQIIFKPTIDDLNNSDIDRYISNEVIPKIKDKEFDIIYIKDTLSENYIDFYGLILAYHIRLSSELNEKKLVPIVILSEINSYAINKITLLGNILFTKNVFLSENTLSSVEKFESLMLTKLTTEDYQSDFLNKVEIKPPKDYLSHHSITNEWAIYQWSHLLCVHTEATQNNENKINTMLYFKYLVNRYSLTPKNEISDDIKTKAGNILLIDDKCDDGWHDVLYRFMKKNYSNVEFDSLGSDFKDIKEIGVIKEQIKIKINEFKPDIILLDLRLMEEMDNLINIAEDENSPQHINKISGIQILKYLKDKTKGFNQGIQIIMFTASGDSLILDELHSKGILGYVKKDAPADKYQASINNINRLNQLIEKGLERSYLKEIWLIRNELKSIIEEDPFRQFISNKYEYNEHIDILIKEIEYIFEILQSDTNNKLKYAMISIYTSFETIEKIFMKEVQKTFEFKDESKTIVSQRGSLTKRIVSILIQKLNVAEFLEIEQALKDIAKKRNDYLHSNKSISISPNDILKSFDILLETMKYIKNPKSKKERKQSGIRFVSS